MATVAIEEEREPAARLDRARANNFNALRILFATAVVFSHSFPMVGSRAEPIENLLGRQTYAAELAVYGFFVISGLLVTESWLRSDGLWNYLKKRILRIYPGFVVAALVCLVIVGPLGAPSAAEYFRQINVLGFLKQAATLGQLTVPPTFAGCPFAGSINGSLWTIRIEFECYLLVAALGLAGLLRKKAILWPAFVLAILLGGILDQRFASVVRHLPAGLVFGAGPKIRLVACFLAGMLFSLERPRVRFTAAGLWLSVLISAAAADVGALWFVLPLTGSYLLFYAAYNERIPLRRFGSRIDLSYGTYLYAWPLQLLVVYWTANRIGPYPLVLLATIASYAAAFLSWTLVERPALSLKRRTTGIAPESKMPG